MLCARGRAAATASPELVAAIVSRATTASPELVAAIVSRAARSVSGSTGPPWSEDPGDCSQSGSRPRPDILAYWVGTPGESSAPGNSVSPVRRAMA